MTVERLLAMLALVLVVPLGLADAPTDANYIAAVKLIKAKQYAPARTLLATVLERYPNSMQALYAAAYAAEHDKAPEVARNLYRKMLHVGLALKSPTEDEKRLTDRAREALGRISPASLSVLRHAEQLAKEAEKLEDETERSILLLAHEQLKETAIGHVEIELPERTILMDPEKPEETLGWSKVERALGYKLDGNTRRKDHRSAKRWQGNRHWYKYFEDALSFEEVSQRCREMGGYPVTVSSKEEREFLVKLLNRRGTLLGMVYDEDREVKNITGEPVYIEWAPSHPRFTSPASPAPGKRMKHVRMSFPRSGIVTATTWAPRGPTGFVCEWEK